jgi:3-phenylpropionate/cinnamic acid dioxygenase small subunit
MTLSAEDRTAVTELISLHGHLIDDGELDRLAELFTADIVYDVSDLGGGSLEGVAAIRDASIAMGELNPVGHHVTNVILSQISDDEVRARSKGIGIGADGTSGSVVYEDTVSRTVRGWRISRRKVLARRVPLGGKA